MRARRAGSRLFWRDMVVGEFFANETKVGFILGHAFMHTHCVWVANFDFTFSVPQSLSSLHPTITTISTMSKSTTKSKLPAATDIDMQLCAM